MIELNGKQYELIENSKDGFQAEAVAEGYSEVLKSYDYIVGDWSYSQLRLKGLYHPGRRNASYNARLEWSAEYRLVYYSYGRAYFVLKKVDEEKPNLNQHEVLFKLGLWCGISYVDILCLRCTTIK